jgi:uncharacterized membrane protein YhiD involved in acid resistance
MSELFQLMFAGDPLSWRTALLSMTLAFLAGQAIAMLYVWSYRGLSYSRAVPQAMIIVAIVSAWLMLAIGDNLARGVGIVGALAFVRFRTNLRDPWDLAFVFGCLAAGVSAGTGSYGVMLAGTGVFIVVIVYLKVVLFGSRRQYDGLLRLSLPADPAVEARLTEVLREQCRSFILVTLREAAQGEEMEHAYQVRLRDPEDRSSLMAALSAVPGLRAVNLLMQEATVEL